MPRRKRPEFVKLGNLVQTAPKIDDSPKTLNEIVHGMLSVQANAILMKIREIDPAFESRYTLATYPRNTDPYDLMITQVLHLRPNEGGKEVPEREVKQILKHNVMERTEDGWFFQIRVGLKGLGFDDELVALGLIPDPQVAVVES